MQPVKILCISGSGRSGSTLLSLLLSQNDDVFNLGQLRDLWKAFSENRDCSCGSRLGDCALWRSVIDRAGEASADPMKIHRKMRRFIKDAEKTGSSMSSEKLERLKHKHRKFLATLGSAIEACRELTGSSILVDSSKSPEMALAFSLLDGVEVYLVNLVRDPRALVCSWAKKDGNNRRSVSSSQEWLARQRRLGAWENLDAIKYFTRLRYEDLSARPVYYVERILRWIGADPGTEFFSAPNQASISWQRQHLFPPANENMLRERSTRLEISEARAWRRVGNWWLHLLAIRHSFPDGILYILRRDSGKYLV